MLYYAVKVMGTEKFVTTGYKREARLYPKLFRRRCDATRIANAYVSRQKYLNMHVDELQIVEFEVIERG